MFTLVLMIVALASPTIHTVQFPVTPGSGYSWFIESKDSSLVVEEKHISNFDPQSPRVGQAEMVQFLISGYEKKSSDITFVYGRNTKEFTEKHTITLNISESLTYVNKAFVTKTSGLTYTQNTYPVSYDLCQLGYCPAVKTQGKCSSCWAFSTVASLESQVMKTTGQSVGLSEQYLINCNDEHFDCEGGWFVHNYHQVNGKKVASENESGAVQTAVMPYTAENGTCGLSHEKAVKLLNWSFVGKYPEMPTVDQIKQALLDHGMLSSTVCVDSNFTAYKSGVLSSEGCDSVNHGVNIVGWDDTKEAWKIRNSWGPGWGEGGYMWIRYGTSQIGFASSFVTLDTANMPNIKSDDTVVGCATTDISSCGFWAFIVIFLYALWISWEIKIRNHKK